jgi:uncharacterized Zn finger protein
LSELAFNIKSQTTNDTYSLVVTIADGLLFVTCSCPAGWNDSICKHRVSILKGDPGMLLDPADVMALTRLSELKSLVERTPISQILQDLATRDVELAQLKSRIATLKRALAAAMADGSPVE